MPDPAVTLRDVARRAGVHPATASRALNPETRALVSDDTARRISDAAAALGYRPNAVRTSGSCPLASGSTRRDSRNCPWVLHHTGS